ncbi:hypothetical protein CDD81_5875 [Ophiocordyceps australis]|uniref:Uncharacterized protein n=1 Tax=Ophiocordyceps australis TaxID=1399860 RepID=A0A2C5YGK4_9HYPO|nr:hypothetical protein CDD81_5875 [Ophiocordyceps australis]
MKLTVAITFATLAFARIKFNRGGDTADRLATYLGERNRKVSCQEQENGTRLVCEADSSMAPCQGTCTEPSEIVTRCNGRCGNTCRAKHAGVWGQFTFSCNLDGTQPLPWDCTPDGHGGCLVPGQQQDEQQQASGCRPGEVAILMPCGNCKPKCVAK